MPIATPIPNQIAICPAITPRATPNAAPSAIPKPIPFDFRFISSTPIPPPRFARRGRVETPAPQEQMQTKPDSFLLGLRQIGWLQSLVADLTHLAQQFRQRHDRKRLEQRG